MKGGFEKLKTNCQQSPRVRFFVICPALSRIHPVWLIEFSGQSEPLEAVNLTEGIQLPSRRCPDDERKS